MKICSLNITLAILVSIFNTSIAVAQDSAPAGWRKFDVEGKFSFYLPPSMHDTDRGSLENLHHEYTNGRMQMDFDYKAFFCRAYVNRARVGTDFHEMELEVDGKKAFLFTYQSRDWKKRRWYVAELHVGDLPNCDVILWMTVSSRSPRALEIAKTIFRTINFP